MAVFYCQVCDRYIDLDWDVEHYDRCPTLPDEEEEDPAVSNQVMKLETKQEELKDG